MQAHHPRFGEVRIDIHEVKILKKPKFDITKLMELHGDGGTLEAARRMLRR